MIKKNILAYAFFLISICTPTMHNGMPIVLKLHSGLMLFSYGFYAMKFGSYILRSPSVRKKLPKKWRLKNKKVKEVRKDIENASIDFEKSILELFTPTTIKCLNEYNKRAGKDSSSKIAERNLFTLALLSYLPENSKNVLVYS